MLRYVMEYGDEHTGIKKNIGITILLILIFKMDTEKVRCNSLHEVGFIYLFYL